MNESHEHSRFTINIALGAVSGIAVQLLLAVLVAIIVGQLVSETASGMAGGTLAVLVGLLLAFPLLRTLWMVANRIEALYLGEVADPLPPRWHFLLAGFVEYLNAVIERVNVVTTMREGLIDQTREAASQQERNRLARDLHDSIKQQIFGISMSAAAIDARWASDPEGARQSLADVQENARAAMVEMTALLQQLSPAPLEKVGLVQALRDQCEALAYRTGAQVEAEFGLLPDDDRLLPGTGDNLFRVVQEALSNIARHARAENVRLFLGMQDDAGALTLTITDDGQGFEPDHLAQGMGLTNIHHRIRALDGHVNVQSAPGEGTTLEISIPLVQPLKLSEDVMEVKTDHSLNKTFLAGLGGGLLTTAALIMPFFVSWQARILAGSELGLSVQDAIFVVLASLIVTTTGYIAARWAGASSRGLALLLGSFAGGTAMLIAYGALLAPASGMAAVQPLWDWGFQPAMDDPHAMWLTAENVVNSIWYTNLAFWPTFLAGIVLGALGGLFAPLHESAQTDAERRHVLGALAALMSVTSSSILVISFLIFFLLEEMISGRTSSGSGAPIPEAIGSYAISLPTEGVLLVPFFSALLLCLISVGGWYIVRRKQVLAGDPVAVRGDFTISICAALISLGLGIFTLLRGIASFRIFGMEVGLGHIGAALILITLAGAFAGLTVREIQMRDSNQPFFAGWNPLVGILILVSLVGVLINIGAQIVDGMPDFVVTIVSLVAAGAMAFATYQFWPRRRAMAVLAFVAAAGLLVMLITGWIWGFAFIIILSAVVVLMAFAMDRNQRRLAGDELAQARFRMKGDQQSLQHHINSLGIVIPVAGIGMSQILPAALTIVLTIVVAISPLFSYDADPISQTTLDIMNTPLSEYAQSLYFVHAKAMVGYLVSLMALAGLVALAWRIDMVLVRRRIARLEERTGQDNEVSAEAS